MLTVVVVVFAEEPRRQFIAALALALDAVVEVPYIRRHVPSERRTQKHGNAEKSFEGHFCVL